MTHQVRDPSSPSRRGLRTGRIASRRARATFPVVLTGTPGVGKKTIAPILARSLGLRAMGLNEFVPHAGPGHRKTNRNAVPDELLVDTVELRESLLRRIAHPDEVLLYGHLIPDVLHRGEARFVAVLRCEPEKLKARLLARGYARAKLVENVEAELIGVVLDSSLTAFGPAAVHEYDTSSSDPGAVARKIARDCILARGAARSKRQTPRSRPWVDWTLRYDSSSRLMSLLSTPGTDPAST